ncbi:male-specific protein scotti-like [Scaptodrosophila lebanonensis]|uniref:Male-specific protein scotti n=1 Tax=Drosophila lebanonensis TaxID=7225 RepID=A0A6J2TVV9_DROLE|nr:male-specific protein scotti-like [Scaptodrosophila lebanonensis]
MEPLELPEPHVPQMDSDEDDADSDDIQVIRLNNPQMAILLDAPHEPPLAPMQLLAPNEEQPLQPLKKRNFYTMSSANQAESEMCGLMQNVMRAMKEARPENPREFFANYMMENLNSNNYPKGEGLPDRWGHF